MLNLSIRSAARDIDPGLFKAIAENTANIPELSQDHLSHDDFILPAHPGHRGVAPASTNTRLQNEKPDGGAIVGGILVTIPFLWVTEYKKEHSYEYDCGSVEGLNTES